MYKSVDNFTPLEFTHFKILYFRFYTHIIGLGLHLLQIKAQWSKINHAISVTKYFSVYFVKYSPY